MEDTNTTATDTESVSEAVIEAPEATNTVEGEQSPSQESNDFSEMSDEDFLNSEPPVDVKDDVESKVKPTEDNTTEIDNYDEQYSSQMDDTDMKLEKPIFVKFKGITHKLDSVDEMRNLLERGLGASTKYQEMAEGRKQLQFLEDNNITQDILESFIQSQGQDVAEPTQANNVEVDTIANEILGSRYADDFKEVAMMLPSTVRDEMADNPKLVQAVYEDVQNGTAKRLMPKVDRLMAQGMDFRDAYGTAYAEMVKSKQQTQANRNTIAANTQSTGVAGTSANQSLWDMSDEDFARFNPRG